MKAVCYFILDLMKTVRYFIQKANEGCSFFLLKNIIKADRYFIQEANERSSLFNSRISWRKTIMLFKNLTKAVYHFIQI